MTTITVYYKSGPSKVAALDDKQADEAGNASSIWKVGLSTTPGNWRIVVTASKDRQTVAKETSFTVSE